MTVATSTAGGGDAGGAGFLPQERQTSPARRTLESFIDKESTGRGCRTRDANIWASDVLPPNLSFDNSTTALLRGDESKTRARPRPTYGGSMSVGSEKLR